MKPRFVRLLWLIPAALVGFFAMPVLTVASGHVQKTNSLLLMALGAIACLSVALGLEWAVHRRNIRRMREMANSEIAREVAERTRVLSQSRESLIEEIKELRNSESRLQSAQAVLEETTGRYARLSSVDAITNLADHERFSEYLEHEWRRAISGRHYLALLLVKVDCFKQFSETYGHGIADDCLRAIAEVLTTAACRTGDLVARIGKEEFAVLLRDTQMDGALHVARQVEAITEQLAIEHETTKVQGSSIVTVSIGVAAIQPGTNNAPSLLIYHADEALYAAKQDGSNCIRSYEDSTGTHSRSRLLEVATSGLPERESYAPRSRR